MTHEKNSPLIHKNFVYFSAIPSHLCTFGKYLFVKICGNIMNGIIKKRIKEYPKLE
jgi:hypothetical protein